MLDVKQPRSPSALLLASMFPPQEGGVARMLGALVDRFLPDQLIVLATERDLDRPPDSPLIVLPPSSGAWVVKLLKRWVSPLVANAWHFVPTGLGLMRRRRIEVVLCGHLQVGLAALLIAMLSNRPLVTLAYGDELLPARSRRRSAIGNWLQQRVLLASHRVFTISDFSRQLLLDRGLAAERIVKLPLGAEVPAVAIQKVDAGRMLRELGLVGRQLVLSVGRLIPQKGHDVLIEAMPAVLAAIPGTACVIAGSGPEEARLRHRIHELGLDDAIRVTGFVSDDRLAGLYDSCDVFALISRDISAERKVEGFGLVFLEANAWSKPVIGGNSGGVPDAIVDGETGFLVEPEDPTEVAKRLIELLGDRDLAQRLGRQGRERVEREYNWDVAAARLAEGLREVVLESHGEACSGTS